MSSGCTDSDDTGIGNDHEVPDDDGAMTEDAEVDDPGFTNSAGMQFVKIPVGEFYMGAPEGEMYSDKDERPVHQVSIGYEFYIGVYEVTQEQWKTVMGTDPSEFKGNDLPVEKVSWHDVEKFVDKLNEMEGTDTYRLPTEAEWEYAARAGTSTAFSFGNDKDRLSEYAWYDGNSEKKTHPVGMKDPNPWGLYDVHGNVAEWVLDEYHSNYQKAPTDGSEWTAGVGRWVIRGGNWNSIEHQCRSASRESIGKGSRMNDIGFRLVKEI
ncbi:formylglycine-generating enzyme family protein [Methanolobus sp. WCC5]|uniref:formylglycine-generating enzyme family protein n=1 Tax=Methanolobus sp. WCC5 TaxID=3125785 RepID=UPI0032476B81